MIEDKLLSLIKIYVNYFDFLQHQKLLLQNENHLKVSFCIAIQGTLLVFFSFLWYLQVDHMVRPCKKIVDDGI